MVLGVTDESVIMLISRHTEAFSNTAANIHNHNDRITKLEEDIIIALEGSGSTLTGGNGITITNDVITVDFSHSGFNTTNIIESTNLYYTDERVDDRVYGLLQGGANITLAYDDFNGTLTIDAASSTPTNIDITPSNSNATYYPVSVDGAGSAKTLFADTSTTPISVNPSSGDFNVVDTIKIDTTKNNISIGKSAGETELIGTRDYSVAIGFQAGQTNQQGSCVAIGNQAGEINQGNYCVAIGNNAGFTGQHANTIVLNASGVALNTLGTDRFIVKPVRDIGADSGFFALYYNPVTGEIGNNTTPTPTYAGAQITQTITDSGGAQIDLDNWISQVATGITVANSSGDVNVFTAITTGWYSLGFSLQIEKPTGSGATNFTFAILRIKRNNNTIHTLESKIASGGQNNTVTVGGSFLINMSAGQTITLRTNVDLVDTYKVTGFASLVKVD